MRSQRFFNDLAEELRELPKEVCIIAIGGIRLMIRVKLLQHMSRLSFISSII
jgi:hypothetical protein